MNCSLSAVAFCIFSLFLLPFSAKENIKALLNTEGEYTGIPLVIYDTDIGSSTDDLFALRLLYYYSDLNMCKILGGVVCRIGEEYVAVADLMNTFYGYGELPMGVERSGVEKPKAYINYTGIAGFTNADGSLMFKRSISDYSVLPDGWKLYRKLLADQPDNSVRICATGFMSSLVQLLKSTPDEYSDLSGVELVKKKVKGLYVMGGKFGEDDNSKPGYNFGHKAALEFSRQLFELWPPKTNIYFSPSRIGDDVDYPTEMVLDDISWTDNHPIKQIYKTSTVIRVNACGTP